MKKFIKKFLFFFLTFILIFPSTIIAFSDVDPSIEKEVSDNQEKFEEINDEISKMETELININGEIEKLLIDIEENNAQINSLLEEIEKHENEIKILEEKIKEGEDKLSARVREFYKNNETPSYLMLLINSKSFNELVSNIRSINSIVKNDKEIMKDLNTKRNELDNEKNLLNDKKNKLNEIKIENEEKLELVNNKKLEQENLINENKILRDSFEKEYLAVSERKLITYQKDLIENQQTTIDELNSAIYQLETIRDNQIKSDIVKNEINDLINTAYEKIEKLKKANIPSTPINGVTGNDIVNYAYNFIGCPYVWGATGPDSFDCSGLTSYVYRNAAGIEITRTTYTQINVGIAVSYDELQPGDLVFPSSGHVGIYVGNGCMIHAPYPGTTVQVSSIYSFYAARRIIY